MQQLSTKKRKYSSQDVKITDNKKQTDLIESLKKHFLLERRPIVYNPMMCFHFSNDEGIQPILQSLVTNKMERAFTTKIQVAIIVGNGYLPSSLPFIDADIILLCDKNIILLNWMESLISSYLCSDNREIFFNNLISDLAMAEEEINFSKEALRISLHREQMDLGEFDYFNPQFMQICKKSLKYKHIIPIPIDFFDEDKMSLLGDLLWQKSAEINFMNLTNLWQWVPEDKQAQFANSLLELPFSTSPLIISSSNHGRLPGEYPIFQPICQSIRDYVETNSEEVSSGCAFK